MSQFLDLGHTPPADDFLVEKRLSDSEIHYPLQVVRCDQCNFIQLSYVVKPEILYQNDYPYEASITKTGVAHFDEFAGDIVEKFGMVSEDLAIDIGSNVGVLLASLKKRNVRILGVDPAANIAEIANKNGIETLPEFFSEQLAQQILMKYGKAKIITGSNVFAHIDDLKSLTAGVKILLEDSGVFVIEAPYFVHLLHNLEYDTIYHEHLSYISVSPLVSFFKSQGMDVFDVRQQDIHGGSIRIFVAISGQQEITSSVDRLVEYEKNERIYSPEVLNDFACKVRNHRDELVWLLKSLKHSGSKIAGVSAPAKGMTLLNYCKIGTETLEFLTEKSTLKIGKFSPGGHIPILPDEALIERDIDYALLLAWNFKDEIMNNLFEFRAKGGKFIVPIPHPVVVRSEEYQHKI